MNWDAIGAIAETLGAVGVIVSLVYLATQIRHSRDQMSQNSKLLTASATTAAIQTRSRSNEMMIQDSEVARIFWDGIVDRDSLTLEDQGRFDPLILLQFEGRSQDFLFYRQGVSSAESWDMAEAGIGWMLEYPGYQQWWRLWGNNFSSEFQDYINGRLRDLEQADSEATVARG